MNFKNIYYLMGVAAEGSLCAGMLFIIGTGIMSLVTHGIKDISIAFIVGIPAAIVCVMTSFIPNLIGAYILFNNESSWRFNNETSSRIFSKNGLKFYAIGGAYGVMVFIVSLFIFSMFINLNDLSLGLKGSGSTPLIIIAVLSGIYTLRYLNRTIEDQS